MGSENSSRKTGVSFLEEYKSGWRWTTVDDDRKYIPTSEESAEVSLKVSHKQRSQHFKEKLSKKVEVSNIDARKFGNSRKRRKPEKPKYPQNERVLKVHKKKMFLVSQESSIRCFQQLKDYQGSSKTLNKSPSENAIRSVWL